MSEQKRSRIEAVHERMAPAIKHALEQHGMDTSTTIRALQEQVMQLTLENVALHKNCDQLTTRAVVAEEAQAVLYASLFILLEFLLIYLIPLFFRFSSFRLHGNVRLIFF